MLIISQTAVIGQLKIQKHNRQINEDDNIKIILFQLIILLKKVSNKKNHIFNKIKYKKFILF